MDGREGLPVGMAWSGECCRQDLQGEIEHFCRVTVVPGGAVQTEERLMQGQWGMRLSSEGADDDSRCKSVRGLIWEAWEPLKYFQAGRCCDVGDDFGTQPWRKIRLKRGSGAPRKENQFRDCC